MADSEVEAVFFASRDPQVSFVGCANCYDATEARGELYLPFWEVHRLPDDGAPRLAAVCDVFARFYRDYLPDRQLGRPEEPMTLGDARGSAYLPQRMECPDCGHVVLVEWPEADAVKSWQDTELD